MAIPFSQLYAERYNTTYLFKGVNHGGWTELLCTSQPSRLGMSAWS